MTSRRLPVPPDRRFQESDFKLVKQIGAGSFGTVYEAIDQYEGKNEAVAIKKIDKKQNQIRIQNEVHALSQLKHPNIVKLFGSFYDAQGNFCIVMELCEHGSLSDYIQTMNSQRLTEPSAAHILRQLVSAMKYCHSMKILHRDLSAGNIFLKNISDPNKIIVKVGDFGLATLIEKGQNACTVVGTPGFIAPDVFGRDYDDKVDVYSLGGILYRMLTGNNPPQKGRITRHIGVSEVAMDLIITMMEPEPSKRIRLEDVRSHPFLELTGDRSRSRSRDVHPVTDMQRLTSRNGQSFEALQAEVERLQAGSGRFTRGRSGSRHERDEIASQHRSRPVNSSRRPSAHPPESYRRSIDGREDLTGTVRQRSASRQPPLQLQQIRNDWPLKLDRLSDRSDRGRKVTPNGRVVVVDDRRVVFEYAQNGSIAGVVSVDIDNRGQQTVSFYDVLDLNSPIPSVSDPLLPCESRPYRTYFSLDQIPEDHKIWYNRTVNTVKYFRKMTAKITVHNPRDFPSAVKCEMMENGDLKIHLKDRVTIVCWSAVRREIVMERMGSQVPTLVTDQNMRNNVDKLLDYVLKNEEINNQFPITINQNPRSSAQMMTSSRARTQSHIATQRQPLQSSQSVNTIQSAPSMMRTSSNRSSALHSTGSYGNENGLFTLKKDATGTIRKIVAKDGSSIRISTAKKNSYVVTQGAAGSEKRFEWNKASEVPADLRTMYLNLMSSVENQRKRLEGR